MADYQFPRTLTAVGYDLGNGEFSKIVAAAVPGKPFKMRCDAAICDIIFDEALTPTEEAALDAAVTAFSVIGRARTMRYAEIDARTEQLVAEGFEFPPAGGQIFSLSGNAQKNLLGLKTMAEDPLFLYPVIWNTLDDSGTFSIPDSTTALAFYATAVGTVRARMDSGTAVKDLIRAATTVDEVMAITDPR